jgi:hypothetical protein
MPCVSTGAAGSLAGRELAEKEARPSCWDQKILAAQKALWTSWKVKQAGKLLTILGQSSDSSRLNFTIGLGHVEMSVTAITR